MALFIRHNCGERKDNVGHRWFNGIEEFSCIHYKMCALITYWHSANTI